MGGLCDLTMLGGKGAGEKAQGSSHCRPVYTGGMSTPQAHCSPTQTCSSTPLVGTTGVPHAAMQFGLYIKDVISGEGGRWWEFLIAFLLMEASNNIMESLLIQGWG